MVRCLLGVEGLLAPAGDAPLLDGGLLFGDLTVGDD